MKKIIIILTIAFLCVGLNLFNFAQQTAIAAGKKELSFQSNYPPMHPTVKLAFQPWMKSVEEKSGGKLKINFFPPKAIVKEKELFDSIESGLLDIGSTRFGTNPGKFPIFAITELPLLFPSSLTGAKVVWKLFEKYPEMQNEFKGVRLLWIWNSATAHVMTTKKAVKTLEDMKGLKIIGYTPTMLETIKALGANPVHLSPLDSYLALQRGMADGIIIAYPGCRALKLQEACKYATESSVLTIPFYAIMSPTAYDGLSADMKSIINETTALKMTTSCSKALDMGSVKSLEFLKANGMTIYPLPVEEKERWLKAVKPVHDNLINKLVGQGHKQAPDILKTLKTLTAEMSGK